MRNVSTATPQAMGVPEGRYDVVVVGAGFAGMYMLHRLRGLGFSVRVFEAGDGVGGTWYWNRYPGARCDVESMEYSYQFSNELQQEWEWTERYAAQPEILKYANHVADRFDLRKDIQFNTRVTAVTFDVPTNRWTVETGDGLRTSAAFVVMATGCLSAANVPNFPGRESFRGPWYHTGNWPHEGVDFTGKRVAIIGNGSSAVQSIPIIAQQAAHLTVFQRTATYAIPARNAPMDPEYQQGFKTHYPELRAKAKEGRTGLLFQVRPFGALEVSDEDRRKEFQTRWNAGGLSFMYAFNDLLISRKSNDTAAQFVRDRIREAVQDPATADALSPQTVIGCKRLCIDTGYYEAFNRPNVTLIDIKDSPIEAITPSGVRVKGQEHVVDAIVFATGFDAMTGALTRIDIKGLGGRALKEKWSEGPRTYLGLATHGFPNLFTITGPGSPSVLSNMLPSIEQHVEWVADCIRWTRDKGFARIEAMKSAEDEWVAHTNAIANVTLYPSCNSWYVGANIPGKPRVFMPYLGFPAYKAKCEQVAGSGYEGFAVTRA
ncbi:MAG TPA: NAD(P)/FAD-dependent oxidoreductase [bacterium]